MMKKILLFCLIAIAATSCKTLSGLGELGINCGVTIKDGCIHEPRMCTALKPVGPAQAYGLKGITWSDRDTLLYAFLDGQKFQKDIVRKRVSELNGICRIVFVETTRKSISDIRISFKYSGSWSYKGTDAKRISKSDATMNYGWIDKYITEDESRRVVHHEFGHSFGMCHEQQHPLSPIKWDSTANYEYYGKMGWSKQDVNVNVFGKANVSETNFTEYDKTSIMHYPVSKFMTTDGYSVGWNTKLSKNDIKWLQTNYPFKKTNTSTDNKCRLSK
jgi:hypothetical protein